MTERREEIRAIAGEMLGRLLSKGATGEYTMLARILRPQERILAMALCRIRGLRLVGAQRLMVATDERLLFVEKAMLTRRERFDERPWAEIAGASVSPPAALCLRLADGGELDLSLVQPSEQLGVIADLARTRGEGGRFGELVELGRRKLGRYASMGAEPLLLGLADLLRTDEDVLDMGFALRRPYGLIAVTTDRIVFVPGRGFGIGEPVAEPYEVLTEVRLEGSDGLLFEGAGGSQLVSGIAPEDRALTLVERVRARLAS